MPKILRVRAAHDEKEERWVRKLAGSRHGPADWIFHARMVSRSWDGERVETIAKELHRFETEGIEGLGDRLKPGRPRRLTAADESKLIALVLRSLKTITKETPVVSRYLWRAPPDPWFGPQVELSSRDAGGLLDFLGIGKALPSQRIAAEEAPPALLQIEPTCSGRNEDLLDARMLFQPGACLQAVVTTEIIGDDEDIAGRIISFDVGQQSNVALGIA